MGSNPMFTLILLLSKKKKKKKILVNILVNTFMKSFILRISKSKNFAEVLERFEPMPLPLRKDSLSI